MAVGELRQRQISRYLSFVRRGAVFQPGVRMWKCAVWKWTAAKC